MENLENLFKKAVYTGIGLLSVTKDKLEKTVEDLVNDDKLSASEGERIMKDFFKKTEEKKDEMEDGLKKSVDKVVKKFNFAKTTEIEELKNRIEALENLLAKK